MNLAVLVLTGS